MSTAPQRKVYQSVNTLIEAQLADVEHQRAAARLQRLQGFLKYAIERELPKLEKFYEAQVQRAMRDLEALER